MKNLYSLIALGILFSTVQICTAQQAQRTANPPIQLNWDICQYHPDPNPIKRTVSMSPKVQARMDIADTPCATFEVTYTGFTPEAQVAFQHAVDIWSYLIESPIVIKINAQFTTLGPGVLGSAGPSNYYNLSGESIPPNTVFPSALADKLTNSDNDAAGFDINASFSNTFPFYFVLDANPPGFQYDFVSVVLHELGHGLGFAGFGRVDNNDAPTQGLIRFSGFVSIWDQFIENGAETSILTFSDPSVALLGEFTGNDLECNGPLATLENSALNPPTYAPSIWDGGSSYSHWDEFTYVAGDINSLMTPQIGSGEAIHDPGPVALGFMEDMGWGLCESTLDIQNMDFEGFVYHPNPVNDVIYLEAKNTLQSVVIYNMLGQEIVRNTPKTLTSEIKVSNLQSGTYFINIVIGNSTKIIKIVKN